jgi:hypothetical protein
MAHNYYAECSGAGYISLKIKSVWPSNKHNDLGFYFSLTLILFIHFFYFSEFTFLNHSGVSAGAYLIKLFPFITDSGVE